MALIFKCIQTDGIAELSNIVGDDSAGVAAVFDPRADVDCDNNGQDLRKFAP